MSMDAVPSDWDGVVLVGSPPHCEAPPPPSLSTSSGDDGEQRAGANTMSEGDGDGDGESGAGSEAPSISRDSSLEGSDGEKPTRQSSDAGADVSRRSVGTGDESDDLASSGEQQWRSTASSAVSRSSTDGLSAILTSSFHKRRPSCEKRSRVVLGRERSPLYEKATASGDEAASSSGGDVEVRARMRSDTAITHVFVVLNSIDYVAQKLQRELDMRTAIRDEDMSAGASLDSSSDAASERHMSVDSGDLSRADSLGADLQREGKEKVRRVSMHRMNPVLQDSEFFSLSDDDVQARIGKLKAIREKLESTPMMDEQTRGELTALGVVICKPESRWRTMSKVVEPQREESGVDYEKGLEKYISELKSETAVVSNISDLPEAAQSYVTNHLLEHYSRANLEENMRALVGSLRIAKKFAICTRDMAEDGYKRSKDLADVEEVYEPFESVAIEVNCKKLFKNIRGEGKGSFGSVTIAKSKRGKDKVAIKKMSLKSKKRIDMCAREASILKSLKHENVVAFKSLYSFQGEGWLIMQYLNGGTVEQVLQRMELPESVVCFITHEIMQGLYYLHQLGLVHRDIKSNNVMLTTLGEVKLVDFGFACQSTGKLIHRPAGTSVYLAPEIVRHGFCNEKVDLYALGVLMIELAEGRRPHHDNPLLGMYRNATSTLEEVKEKQVTRDFSRHFHRVMRACLKPDPKTRPPASLLVQDPWFVKCREYCEAIHQKLAQLVEYAWTEKSVEPF